MIKFFRKIRQELLSSGKTGKYLKYAIGEIVLVVIGILIALQINNWNENHKNQLLSKDILFDIFLDLKKDSLDIIHHINFSEDILKNLNEIINRTRKKSTTLDTLISIGKNEFDVSWVAPIKYNTTTFESIKSSGKIELLPDSLKKSINLLYSKVEYYEKSVEDLTEQYKSSLQEFTKKYIPNNNQNSNYLAYSISWDIKDKNDYAIKFDILLTLRKILWEYYFDSLKRQQIRIHKEMELIKVSLE